MPACGRGAEQLVDLRLGADVDAAGRLVEQQQLRLGEQPPAEHDLLLVAARERADRRRGSSRSLHLQPLDHLPHGAGFLGRTAEPGRRRADPQWTRRCWRARSGRSARPRDPAVLGHHGDAQLEVRRAGSRGWTARPSSNTRPAQRPRRARAEERLQQFGAARAEQAGRARRSPRPRTRQRDPVGFAAAGPLATGVQRRGRRSRSTASPGSPPSVRKQRLHRAADHRLGGLRGGHGHGRRTRRPPRRCAAPSRGRRSGRSPPSGGRCRRCRRPPCAARRSPRTAARPRPPMSADVGSSMISTRASRRECLGDGDQLLLAGAQLADRRAAGRARPRCGPAAPGSRGASAAASTVPAFGCAARGRGRCSRRPTGPGTRSSSWGSSRCRARCASAGLANRTGLAVDRRSCRAWPVTSPERIFISVDLPAPFSPSSACTSPASHGEVDVPAGERAAVGLADAGHLDQRGTRLFHDTPRVGGRWE